MASIDVRSDSAIRVRFMEKQLKIPSSGNSLDTCKNRIRSPQIVAESQQIVAESQSRSPLSCSMHATVFSQISQSLREIAQVIKIRQQ